ncbi:porphobilinogen deaminase, dipyromethane cofactor binding domain-domain-containing protein [Protomyces lactucae-debilis]|uniref:Porphobilinogen deaminase n=1 Tax=Protomyces lactucae-debilis TaxID=2754530 RepID=A0A1Y2FV46_PROLT|nr:porphobilinogen deaminase, dipyromethane cofactor binding domain-containing protein [Protomyces lactucae-debilis]ORY87839.1 porphobilinogen deaminase, dipyromethane cofactor binding domain-domain-containing protein [Protomyces lactucae-debilis]
MPGQTYPIGTRKSKLAMVQAEQVQRDLQQLYPEHTFPIVAMSAMGDVIQTKPLHQFSSQMAKGLWTQELEDLLARKECRLVVNCLKDLPTTLPDGFKITSVGKTEDPRDVVVMAKHCPYKKLSDLPEGSVVGTSSIRRSAQIKRACPYLAFKDVRGNVGTRLDKLDNPELGYSCLILAAAGLARLGLLERVTEYLEAPTMFHSPGQGTLALEICEDDLELADLLKPLNHHESMICTWAERSMMRYLQGGCSVPIGCETAFTDGKLSITAVVVSVDGKTAVQESCEAMVETYSEAERLGEEVAEKMVVNGAKVILDEIELTRHRDLDTAQVNDLNRGNAEQAQLEASR